MAMTKCKECGEAISDAAESCPHCGAPLKSTKSSGKGDNAPRQYGCGTLLLVIIVGIVLVSIFDTPQTETQSAETTSHDTSDTGSDGNLDSPDFDTIKQYAHQTINVRAGPSTDHEVVGQVERGDVVRIAFTQGDWREIVTGEYKGHYIYSPLLEGSPVPEEAPAPNIEIASWNWRPDPNFGVDGAVIWTVEVRNNTNSYIEGVRVDFSSYNSDGEIMDTDSSYVTGLSPGGTASTKGYATYFGDEEKGRIRISGKY